MTARRAARRERYERAVTVPAGASIDGHPVPPELFDPAAAVWHDQSAYHRYMTGLAWSMPPQERMGVTASPRRRRHDAVGGWAEDNGLTNGPYPDWARLRELFGL